MCGGRVSKTAKWSHKTHLWEWSACGGESNTPFLFFKVHLTPAHEPSVCVQRRQEGWNPGCHGCHFFEWSCYSPFCFQRNRGNPLRDDICCERYLTPMAPQVMSRVSRFLVAGTMFQPRSRGTSSFTPSQASMSVHTLSRYSFWVFGLFWRLRGNVSLRSHVQDSVVLLHNILQTHFFRILQTCSTQQLRAS